MEQTIKCPSKELPQPEEGSCHFFVQRKKRYCKMLPSAGQKFCGEHQQPLSSGTATEKDEIVRILCPLDRKHTVYAHKLQKHLKICNARQCEQVPYIRKDINSGKTDIQDSDSNNDNHRFLSSFSTDVILNVIKKVQKVFNEKVKDNITEKLTTHKLLDNEMQKPDYGDKTKKHLVQVGAILGLLREYGLLTGEKACFIEFGAGRGQLSCWLAQATKSIETSKILIIEKASPKHKRDNKISKSSDKIQRIRADIKDVVLDNVDLVEESKMLIGVTKHLCGEATDLAIRCMSNLAKNRDKVNGAVFTFCCHHRCRWTPYTGKDFFEENGLSKDDFNIMCGISSWATCGSGYSRENREKMTVEPISDSSTENQKLLEDKNDNSDLNKSIEDHLFNQERENELGLTRLEKEEIGRRCKNLINWGRLTFLTNLNLTCLLHYYVPKNVTLENVCIVAYKEQK